MKPRLYKLTEKEIIKLTNALHNPALVNLQGQPLIPANERCLPVWKEIAAARNLKWETCAPVANKGAEYFTADEKELDQDD